MVAPEKVGFLHYTRNGNRDADNLQEIDDAQDTRLANTSLRDALKTVKKETQSQNTDLIFCFLMFGIESSGGKNVSVSIPPFTSVTLFFCQ